LVSISGKAKGESVAAADVLLQQINSVINQVN
jgi:hypothetical protein